MKKQLQRVQGMIITKSIMANQNAGFDGYPRQDNNGEYFATDKSLKYTLKQMAASKGDKILGMKRLQITKGKLQPLSLDETYVSLFGNLPTKETEETQKEVIQNVVNCFDVKTFGTAFAVKKFNLSIPGTVQVYQGYNTLPDTDTVIMDIVSPFRNSNDKSGNSQQSTLGQKYVTDKAMFVFDVTINPNNLRPFEPFGVFLDTDTVDKFKEYSALSTTNYSSNSKAGCSNVLAIYVNLKENSKKLLLPLSEFVLTKYEDKISTIDLTNVEKYLKNYKEDVDSIELFYQADSNVEIIRSENFNYIEKLI